MNDMHDCHTCINARLYNEGKLVSWKQSPSSTSDNLELCSMEEIVNKKQFNS